MTRTLPLVALASLLTVGASIPAIAAQDGPSIVNAQWGRAMPRGDYQRFYNQGYQQGLREGERDARSRRPADYRQHSQYQRGGAGWGNDGAVDDAYRRGFAEGYSVGYDRYRGSYGRNGYPDNGAYSRSPGGIYRYPGYPQGGYYPGGGYGSYSPAASRGFEDGYRDGRDDARDNDRYEPERKKDYRNGDDGFNSRNGSKDQYKAEYRQGFRQGYDQGYREGRYR